MNNKHTATVEHADRSQEPVWRDAVSEAISLWEAQNPDLGSLVGMAIFGRLSRIGAHQRTIFNKRHEAAGLSLSTFDVLATLRRSGTDAEMTPTELADSSMLSLGGISLRLERLEKEGLIRRRRDVHDRRVVHVSLTQRGRILIDTVHGQHIKAQNALLEGFESEELKVLNQMLAKMERVMDENTVTVQEIPVSDLNPSEGSE